MIRLRICTLRIWLFVHTYFSSLMCVEREEMGRTLGSLSLDGDFRGSSKVFAFGLRVCTPYIPFARLREGETPFLLKGGNGGIYGGGRIVRQDFSFWDSLSCILGKVGSLYPRMLCVLAWGRVRGGLSPSLFAFVTEKGCLGKQGFPL